MCFIEIAQPRGKGGTPSLQSSQRSPCKSTLTPPPKHGHVVAVFEAKALAVETCLILLGFRVSTLALAQAGKAMWFRV